MMNEVTLIGNLGGDIDVRQTSNGTSVGNMRLCTNEKYKDKDGNIQSRPEWHKVSFFNIPGGLVQYLTKGRQLLVKGKLETHKWTDSDGIERYTTNVVVRPYKGMVQLLGGRRQEKEETENQQQLFALFNGVASSRIKKSADGWEALPKTLPYFYPTREDNGLIHSGHCIV